MPNPTIDQLLEELYDLDPTLRTQSDAVRQALERMISTTPTLTLSPHLIQQIQTSMMNQPVSPKRTPVPKTFWAGIPLALAAVTAGVLFLPTPKNSTPSQRSGSKVAIHAGSANAFGSFDGATPVNRTAAGESTSTTKDSAAGAISAPSIGIVPPTATITYSYNKPFTIPQLPVLKRDRGFDSGVGISSGGLANLSTFRGLKLDYANATQQTDDGYSITVDYRDGNISMYKQSGVSVSDKQTLTTLAPGRPVAETTITVVKAVAAAKSFASAHGISLSAYDEPTLYYYPGQQPPFDVVSAPATIIFPLSINGLPVFDESANRYGLMMSVDSNEQVVSVSNLTNHSYTSSSYAVTSDTKAITQYLSRGGNFWGGVIEGTKSTTIDLQDPIPGYMISRYQIDQTPDEYLVPALIFGIVHSDQVTTGRAGVVVPVLDQLLNLNASGKIPAIDLPASTSAGSTEPTTE